MDSVYLQDSGKLQDSNNAYGVGKGMSNLQDFCYRLPKCELHAHLNGSISLETIQKLIKQAGHDAGNQCEQEISLLSLKKFPRHIDEAFKIFPLVQRLTERREELITATRSVINDFASENVVYLELRTTPKSSKWMSKREYVETVIETIQEVNDEDSRIVVRLILSVDRRQSIEDASETINFALEYFSKPAPIVVGVELSGDPTFDGRKFLNLFKNAAGRGMPFALHVAELSDCLDELEECLWSRPNRIGHGTFIHNNANTAQTTKCIDFVLKNRIPIEICLTSNYLCGTTTFFSSSHLNYYLDKKHPVVLCTDDRGIMDCSLSGEFSIAAETFKLSPQDLFNLALQSFKAAFIQMAPGNDYEISKIMQRFKDFAKADGLEML